MKRTGVSPEVTKNIIEESPGGTWRSAMFFRQAVIGPEIPLRRSS